MSIQALVDRSLPVYHAGRLYRVRCPRVRTVYLGLGLFPTDAIAISAAYRHDPVILQSPAAIKAILEKCIQDPPGASVAEVLETVATEAGGGSVFESVAFDKGLAVAIAAASLSMLDVEALIQEAGAEALASMLEKAGGKDLPDTIADQDATPMAAMICTLSVAHGVPPAAVIDWPWPVYSVAQRLLIFNAEPAKMLATYLNGTGEAKGSEYVPEGGDLPDVSWLSSLSHLGAVYERKPGPAAEGD